MLQLEDHNLLIETGPITPISINANGDKITCQSPLCQRFVIVFNFFIGVGLPQNITDITLGYQALVNSSKEVSASQFQCGALSMTHDRDSLIFLGPYLILKKPSNSVKVFEAVGLTIIQFTNARIMIMELQLYSITICGTFESQRFIDTDLF